MSQSDNRGRHKKHPFGWSIGMVFGDPVAMSAPESPGWPGGRSKMDVCRHVDFGACLALAIPGFFLVAALM